MRYYGIYANAPRGKVRKAQPDKPPFSLMEEESPGVPRLGWAQITCWGHVTNSLEFGIRAPFSDPLVYPKCQGQMRIIAFITDYAVLDRIINHLKLRFVAERPPPPHVVSQEFSYDSEAPADYFS